MTDDDRFVSGTAAGVPFVALPPKRTGQPDVPLVVAWHLMDAPASPAAMASALPMEGLDAWRVYLGLPDNGDRLPEGGQDELMRRGYEDAVLRLNVPIASVGAQEFPGALAELRDRFGLSQDGRLALVGGSLGSAVVLLTLVEVARDAGITVDAAVVISPVAQLRAAVDATGRGFGVEYPWREETAEVEQRFNFVQRPPANVPLRAIVGEEDDKEGFLEPARLLVGHWSEASIPADLVVIPNMAHGFADAPGFRSAPQTPAGRAVDAATTSWLGHWLYDDQDTGRGGGV